MSGSGMPMFRNFDMTLVMSFIPAFMLPICKSDEMDARTSAMKVALIAPKHNQPLSQNFWTALHPRCAETFRQGSG
jgi:hypothetical protein